MSPTSPTHATRRPSGGTIRRQRRVRIAALAAAAASVIPIAATANAGQVQAASSRQIARSATVTSASPNHLSAPSAYAHVISALPAASRYTFLPAARHWTRPRGLTARGNRIALEIHATFPQIAVMGGYRPERGSDHSTHRAIDNMLPGNYRLPAQRALGFALANWARANAGRLGITYVIWDQHIWNISRDREGWRPMPNRGSDNQNHKNHVHISFR